MHINKLKVLLVGVVLFTLILINIPKNSVRVAERQPSSLVDHFDIAQIKIENKEYFQFDRQMKVVMNGKNILTDIKYSGFLIIEWEKNKNSGEKVGLFSFQVKNAKIPQVLAEVAITNDYHLSNIKMSKFKNEEEENATLFLKDLISVYAFRDMSDTTGKYTAILKEISKTLSETVLMKKKIKYESTDLNSIKFTRSIHEIRVGQNFNEASGIEDVQAGEIKTHGIYQLKRISQTKAIQLGVIEQKHDSISSLALSAIVTNPNKTTEEKTPWESVSKRLNSISNLNKKERLNLFYSLVKALKSNPEKLQELMDWLHADLRNQEKVSLAVGVLATVGTKETQHELVQLFNEVKDSSSENSHLILNSFATSKNKISPEVVGMLNGVLDKRSENAELAINAAYALGAAGEVKKINELAEQSTTKSEKIIYIDAMGNGGSLDSLPFLLESVKSSDPEIREKAIFALRFVSDERVKSVFESSMNDSSVGVRYSVVRALPFQPKPSEYLALLENCVNHSTEKNLKALCTQTITNL